MKIHAVTSLPHYREHVLSVWAHLPEGLKGDDVHGRFARASKEWDPRDIVMVGGFYDIDRARGHRVIYVEHGAGQAYYQENGKRHPAYHGSEHPENVVAYISPRQEVADSWERPAFAAGSPVCDPYPIGTVNDQPVVAITFHWDCKLLPETRSALDHYVSHLGRVVHELRGLGFNVVGHRHPRDNRLPTLWKNLHVKQVDVDFVRRCADILIADNTSLAYEMLYLMRGVVTINAPWYRRDVSHGLRFWDYPPGVMVDDADELLAALSGLSPPPTMKHQGPAEYAYGKPYSDGNDGLRAAAWVTMIAGEL